MGDHRRSPEPLRMDGLQPIHGFREFGHMGVEFQHARIHSVESFIVVLLACSHFLLSVGDVLESGFDALEASFHFLGTQHAHCSFLTCSYFFQHHRFHQPGALQ